MYVEIQLKNDDVLMRINNSLKTEILETGKIDKLHCGKLGFYYLKTK